jgi:hypothetical protein
VHLVDTAAELDEGRRPEMKPVEAVERVTDELVGPGDPGLRPPVPGRSRNL